MNNPAPDQIKQARLKSGLTQTKAGELIYYSMRAWQDWESGKRKMPPAAFELFEIKITELITVSQASSP